MRSVKKLPNIKHDIYKKEISKAFFNKTYPHSEIKTRTLRELNEFTTRWFGHGENQNVLHSDYIHVK